MRRLRYGVAMSLDWCIPGGPPDLRRRSRAAARCPASRWWFFAHDESRQHQGAKIVSRKLKETVVALKNSRATPSRRTAEAGCRGLLEPGSSTG